MKFEELGLSTLLLHAVREQGYHTPTPIQFEVIPAILSGADVLGCAQTGTGKTAAFALPTLDRLCREPKTGKPRLRPIRALVLAPTRELAVQICESFRQYGKGSGLRQTTIFGGVSQVPQERALRAGVDVVVATPGRLLDLVNQGFVDLSHVQVLIVDEADRMLDMGFIHDLKRIVAQCPRKRQTLLFSATIPAAIQNLARQWQTNPVEVRVAPQAATAAQIEQSIVHLNQEQKLPFLLDWLIKTDWSRVIVFTKTKHGADKVARQILKNRISVEALHGNKSQAARQRALARFQMPAPLVLVATDVAARGLDVACVSHVINFDLPNEASSYVHRIGRTGRAQASGAALSLCSRDERPFLRAIENLIQHPLTVAETPQEFKAAASAAPTAGSPQHRPAASKRGNCPPGKTGKTIRPGSGQGQRSTTTSNKVAISPAGRRKRRRRRAAVTS